MNKIEVIVRVSDEARRINMEKGLTIRGAIRKACEIYKDELKENKLSVTLPERR